MTQIRCVPPELHRCLEPRAAKARMSLSAFLLRGAERLADQPAMEEFLQRVRRLSPVDLPESPTDIVREERDRRSERDW